MRRVLAVMMLVLGVVLLPVGAPSAFASETHHGKFVSGVGVNDGSGGVLAPGTYTLDPSGTWNLNIAADGVQVTGVGGPFTKPCLSATTQPCTGFPFAMHVDWVQTAPNVFTGSWQPGPTFELDFTLTYHPVVDGSDMTLRVDITGSGFGWTSWTFEGVEH